MLRKASHERDLHHMIRLMGVLFPLKRDKDTKKSLEALSALAKKKGFEGLYGILQALLAESLSSNRLQKVSETAISMFKAESGVDIIGKSIKKHSSPKNGVGSLLRKL